MVLVGEAGQQLALERLSPGHPFGVGAVRLEMDGGRQTPVSLVFDLAAKSNQLDVLFDFREGPLHLLELSRRAGFDASAGAAEKHRQPSADAMIGADARHVLSIEPFAHRPQRCGDALFGIQHGFEARPAFGNCEEDKVTARSDEYGVFFRATFRPLAADAREQPRGQPYFALGDRILVGGFHPQLLGDLLSL